MSPRSTFQSCGSSSSEHLRMNEPKRVRRLSCCVLQALSCVSLTRMERNFSISNGFLFRPTRFCRNRIGPGEESLTPTAQTSSAGEQRISPSAEPTMSNRRLTKAFAKLSSGMRRIFSSGMPLRSSNWGWLGM